ncbi:MAG: sporulation transcriptional regulator SpoIIID [Clostridia bacterium]|nr:sporulation transcriptional regulator SpoIIID [Clostridia bacterium]
MLYNNAERCEIFARYMIDNNATVRATASRFLISKSTVHKDVTSRLKITNPVLYSEVKKVLIKNKEERHLRGGEATKQKYLSKKKGY